MDGRALSPVDMESTEKNAKKLETKRNTPQLFLRKTKNHIELGNKTDSCKKEFEKCVQQEIRNNDNLIIPVISRALATNIYTSVPRDMSTPTIIITERMMNRLVWLLRETG